MAKQTVIPLPKNTIDETGHTYGGLKVVEYTGVRLSRACWLCECVCGTLKVVSGKQLRATSYTGRAVSCGCLRANPEIRRAARMKTPARRRKAIARMGQAARRASKDLV